MECGLYHYVIGYWIASIQQQELDITVISNSTTIGWSICLELAISYIDARLQQNQLQKDTSQNNTTTICIV